uniref:hypothetical protein n=1 Tax=Marivirga sp. TaxID=2018662 RepID=UPI0025ECB6A4
MIKVKLTWPYNWPIIKQTPSRSGNWGDFKFLINQEVEECDFWVVFDGLKTMESTICPRENILLVTSEPPAIKNYDRKFIKQFGQIITCHNSFDNSNV